MPDITHDDVTQAKLRRDKALYDAERKNIKAQAKAKKAVLKFITKIAEANYNQEYKVGWLSRLGEVMKSVF